MADSKSQQRKKVTGFAAIAAILAAAAALAVRTDFAAEFESRTWDWRLQETARQTAADPAIKLIVVDQASLDYFAREESIFWQWPREMYEPVVRFLDRAGARGVAFDILFTEPSSYGVSDDRNFAAALSSGLPTVMAVAGRRDTAAESASDRALFQKRAEEVAARLGPVGSVGPSFPSVTLPIPEVLGAATLLGNVTSEADADGIFRHVTLTAAIGGTAVPTLPLALHLAVGGALDPAVMAERDKLGRLAVRFGGGAGTYKTYSIRSIIQSWVALKSGEAPSVDLAEFKDAVVFVGMVAPGLLDLRPTPLARDYPGVEFNATVLDNLRNGAFIKKPTAAAAWLWAVLLISIAAAICLFGRRLRTQIVQLLVLGGGAVAVAYIAAGAGWWIPLVVPLGGAVAAVIAGLGLQYELEGRQHRFIKDAFRYYVSPSVIDQIIEDPSNLSLGGVRRELTIYFSDIAGFTSLSEKIEASKLSALLNRFLSEMTDIILQSGGTVDKYVGDAIVAFWNAPIAAPDHAAKGVTAALACQARLHELQGEFERDFGVSIRMRVGLHTGVVSVGNFGSRDRFNYTMIGDAANLASRLEGANKNFGTAILVSAAAKEAAGDAAAFRKVGDITVVGKSEVVTVYEPLTEQTPRSAYEDALGRFERGDREGALGLFKTLPDDPVARAYCRRIEHERGKDTVVAAWNLSEK